MARILVCGYMVRYPFAGMMLAFFHYLAGLHRLGHNVAYLEESGWPGSCYDPHRKLHSDDPSAGLAALASLLRQHDMEIPICYVDRATGQTWGDDWPRVRQRLSDADLLLNVGGVCWLPEFHLSRRRVLIDMDPFFTQIGRFGVEGIEHYDVRFSYGHNIGRPGCRIPPDGYDWLPTSPPVVGELWNDLPPSSAAGAPFTTVANWSAYGAVAYEGNQYGQKDREFMRVLDLPRHTTQPLEVALSGAGIDVRRTFTDAGWRIRDASEVTVDVPAYRRYIAGSRGEFSVAKQAYVKSRSGWFSDRSVCYLAAGRPVVIQDTGIGEWLPVGRGLLCFSSLDEAVTCLDAVAADYPAHCRAASEIGEACFGYRNVLPPLIERALG
jgi:hypothetical protein